MTGQSGDLDHIWGAEEPVSSGSEPAPDVQNNGIASPLGGGGAPLSSESGPGDVIDHGSGRGSRQPPWVEAGLFPPDFPVQPLGSIGQKFYFLSARGELVELSVGSMGHRTTLKSMFIGCDDVDALLVSVAAPQNKRDLGFSASVLGDKLMDACAMLPLYDDKMSIRNFGTWRADTAVPVVHLGERIEVGPDEHTQGRKIANALYPSVAARTAPAKDAATAQEIAFISNTINDLWQFDNPHAGALIIGFVGQAVLGQYPFWRCHMYISGKNGTGKSTLLEIISSLLGGMSSGIHNSATAAGVRQSGNRQALAWIFDEAERKGDSNAVEQIIAMFRLMSGQKGAQELRGTADHSGIKFSLYGAGLLGSIITAHMDAQDLARFVILSIKDRASGGSDAALRLADLEENAAALGPMIWRRMLKLAPDRWDKTFRFYKDMIVNMGARNRGGDTFGALLAGWDLMLFDTAVCADDPRCGAAREIVSPLIASSLDDEDLSEGERALHKMFGAILHKEHGGVTTASEELLRLQQATDKPTFGDNTLLMRLGMRLMDGRAGQRPLFVSKHGSSQLDTALAKTRWTNGSHNDALLTLEGVEASKPQKIFGKTTRGLLVPARFLPGFEETPENIGGFA